ncbi:DUF4139 domain-containing protein [Microvirga sp. W0021]|uniref:DUF4139 domain-containing protein n=1 Tax=Hohaiivirga grylli TaxID=3133970 RepID=A0ABV0BIW9_9HYPH
MRYFPTKTLALSLSVSLIALTAHAAESSAPVTSVRLSSGGLAEVSREISVKGQTDFALTVPLEHVNDVLKTISINDPAKARNSVTLASVKNPWKAFQNVPGASDLTINLGSFLQAFKGQTVTVTNNGKSVTGQIVTIEQQTLETTKEQSRKTYLLTIFSNGKLSTFDLQQVEVSFNDPALRTKMQSAFTDMAATQSSNTRNIDIHFDGENERKVALNYIVPAPVWKATYRLILKPDNKNAELQGWAIIENDTSDDWNDIQLTLSSGSPVTLYQKLYQSYYTSRPEIQIYTPKGIVPRATNPQEFNLSLNKDESDSVASDVRERKKLSGQMRQQKEIALSRNTALMGADAPLSPPAPEYAAKPVSLSNSIESDVSATFTLAQPVTLAQGQSLTTQFSSNDISASRVSVFQTQLGIPNPVAGLILENTSGSSFPSGIMTVFDPETGYVGDAQLINLSAKDITTVLFATDKKVTISSEAEQNNIVSKVTFANGLLKTQTSQQYKTTYTIKGASDDDRTIIIEHPRRSGFTYSSPDLSSDTGKFARLKVSVKKGETVKSVLTETRILEQSYSAIDLENSAPQLALLLKNAAPEVKDSEKIAIIESIMTKIATEKQAFSSYETEISRINSDQARIRSNYQAIYGKGDLAEQYLKTMAEQEKQLQKIANARAIIEKNLQTLRNELAEKLKTL